MRAAQAFVALGLIGAVAVAGTPPAAAQSPEGDLSIDQLHIFVMPAGDHLVISEHYLLGNAGASTYESSPTFSISLPAGSYDVHVGDEDDPETFYEIVDDTVSTSRAIPPGTATSQARLSYSLPLSLGAAIDREVPLPVNSCVVLIAGDQYALEGPRLISFGTMEVGGQGAHAYTLDPMLAGESFSFAVIEASMAAQGADRLPPAGSGAAAGPKTGIAVGVGALALAAAVVVAVAITRRRAVPAPPAAIRDLVVALAELDEQYGVGAISDEDYRARREALKADIRQQLGRSQDD